MNGKDMLMGLSHIDPKFIFEAEKEQSLSKNRIHHPWKKSLLIAAIISLLLLMLGCVWAILGLQDMTLSAPPVTNLQGEEGQLISMQGFKGSKNYEAAQEWQTFKNSYDPDKSILYANNDFGLDGLSDEYSSYGCYSLEMVEKVDEICEKYGLETLGKPWMYLRADHVYEAVGITSVFSADAQPLESPFSGYCYKEGTFQLSGDVRLGEPWNRTFAYNLRSVQKTSFDTVFSSVGNLDTYDQWEYIMEDGVAVHLALQEYGVIIVDKDDRFVMVSVSGTPEDEFAPIPQDRAFMEDFCEAFDFGFKTHRVDPERAYAMQCEEEPHSYEALIEILLAKNETYPNLQYALIDINGDGQDELLLRGDDAALYSRSEFDDNMFFQIMGETDGDLAYIAGAGPCRYDDDSCLLGGVAMYLCEGNVIEILSPIAGDEIDRYYCQYDSYYRENVMDWIMPQEDGLYNQVMGELVKISDEEAKAIAAKYPRIEIDFKPASEFKRN